MNDGQDIQDLLLDLERSRRHEAASRRASEAMVACLRILALGSAPEAMFQALLDELKRTFTADTAFVLSDAGDGALTVIASDLPATLGRRWRRGALLRRLGPERPIVSTFDITLVDDWQGQDAGTPVVSALHIFIGLPERPAFLVCGSARRGHFEAGHIALATALAPLAAQAIARAADHDRLRAEITERIRIEEELRRSQLRMVQLQKMEAVGQLAAGLAHEINTPVQFVSDNLRFIANTGNGLVNLVDTLAGWLAPHMERAVLDQFLDAADFTYLKQELPRALAHCQDGMDRVGHIIHTLKLFAEAGSEEPAPADLNTALKTVITLCQGEYRGIATVTTDLAELPPVPCRIGEIRQVAHSLIINAVQAIAATERPGTIAITTRRISGQIELVIADDGCGMDAEVLRRACDPFFTTRPLGQGTGQGLSIAHEVVRRHGGSLTLDSTPGVGTRVVIRLPIDRPLATA